MTEATFQSLLEQERQRAELLRGELFTLRHFASRRRLLFSSHIVDRITRILERDDLRRYRYKNEGKQ